MVLMVITHRIILFQKIKCHKIFKFISRINHIMSFDQLFSKSEIHILEYIIKVYQRLG